MRCLCSVASEQGVTMDTADQFNFLHIIGADNQLAAPTAIEFQESWDESTITEMLVTALSAITDMPIA
jgi:hypothetical protein